MTLMFSEDIVHALAARDGCEGFVIVCDDTIRILYDAAETTFVCSRERTKCRTLAEALQQHAGVRRRHNFLDIAKIYGVSLRAIANHGDAWRLCSVVLCGLTGASMQTDSRIGA